MKITWKFLMTQHQVNAYGFNCVTLESLDRGTNTSKTEEDSVLSTGIILKYFQVMIP